jgi:hypothetical protein
VIKGNQLNLYGFHRTDQATFDRDTTDVAEAVEGAGIVIAHYIKFVKSPGDNPELFNHSLILSSETLLIFNRKHKRLSEYFCEIRRRSKFHIFHKTGDMCSPSILLS